MSLFAGWWSRQKSTTTLGKAWLSSVLKQNKTDKTASVFKGLALQRQWGVGKEKG